MLSFPRVQDASRRREPALFVRALMALVVWLAVGGHLTGLAHFALISHHVCAAHGELAHGERGHAHATVERDAAATSSPAASGDAAADDDGHEHCSVLARRHEHIATLSGGPTLVVPSPVSEPPPSRPEVLAHRGEDLVALAPKTSPPV